MTRACTAMTTYVCAEAAEWGRKFLLGAADGGIGEMGHQGDIRVGCVCNVTVCVPGSKEKIVEEGVFMMMASP